MMAYVLLLAGYLLLNVYIVLETRFWLRNAWLNSTKQKAFKVLLAVYSLLSLIPVGGAFLPDSSFKFTLQGWGNLWLGLLVYYAMLLLVCKLIWMATGRRKLKHPEQKAALITLVICLAGSVGLNVYGSYHAQDVKVKEYSTVIDKSAGDVTSLKIVLLADLHMSVNSHIETIQSMVNKVNEQNPDVILFAGDFFTSSYDGLKNPEEYEAVLSQLHATYGVYGTYGNHDVVETLFGGFPVSPIEDAIRPVEMDEFIEKSGITLLKDEVITIADGAIQIAGRIDGERAGDGTDHRMDADELLSGTDDSKPLIVVEHEPWQFQELGDAGADLVLSGHTHDGQFFPGNLVVPFFNQNGYGMKEIDGVTSVVTAGIGYYGPPIRVGTDSEITVINVTFKG
ncbi:MAG: metallophosphoesterase [Solobacterium sp.]|jgi:predicted MPP superfamily phosphohydrolase|nr:metallophosphoesterase [Solobacterium sp.]